MGLFLIALLYIFINIKDEEKTIKAFLGAYPVLIMFFIWNPLFSKILVDFIGNDVYWRVYWLLPIGIILAYVFTKLIFTVSDKLKRIIAFFAIFIVIVMSGKCVYSEEFFQKVNNHYKVPDEVLEMILIISNDNEEHKKVAGPEEFMIYTRQIDGNIIVECPRNVYGLYSENSLMMKILRGEVKESTKHAKQKDCNYIIFPKDVTLDGRMENYVYNEFAKNDKYILYKHHYYQQ